MTKKSYIAPSAEVICVNVERGFSGSIQTNDYAADGEAGMLQEGNEYTF